MSVSIATRHLALYSEIWQKYIIQGIYKPEEREEDAYSLNGGLYSLIQIVLVVICVRLFW